MEEITLEQIDLVRGRTGVGYRRAFDALQQTGGDVVRAIVLIESRDEQHRAGWDGWQERLQAGGDEAVRRLRRLWASGNRARVVVRHGDRRILDVPATVGVMGVILAPVLTAVGVAAALATRSTLSVERADEGPAGSR